MKTLTAVYLAAGISSRFGGKIKALVKVGPNNETFLALSMNQAKEAGFNNFVIIVSDKTLQPLKQEFGDSFQGSPIKYAIQKTPEYREKPFGTTHALLSIKGMVDGLFIVLNSDDLYGINAIKAVGDYLKTNKDASCLPGYKLKNVLPEEGTVNRGLIKTDSDGFLEAIEEQFNISREDIPSKYSGEELISMNLFGFQPEFIDYSEKDFNKFLEGHKEDTTAECLIVDTITNFTKETGKKVGVIQTEDIPICVTNPEDEEKVREKLKHKDL